MNREELTLKTLIAQYDAAMRAYATRLCAPHDSLYAEDAIQEPLLNAIVSYPSFIPGNFKSWLFRILQNCCMNQHRSHRRIKNVEQRADLGPRAAREMEELMVVREDGQIARDCVHKYIAPKIVADTVVLKWEQDVTWDEAAEITGLEDSKVASNKWDYRRPMILQCVAERSR